MSIFAAIMGIVSLLASVGVSVYSNKENKKIAQKQIDSAEAINAANIESQEKINQQNIDYQTSVNELMRSDANNAVSIKKRDLINAGYSTADPNLQGSAFASLGTPNLTAPKQDNPFSADIANMLMQNNQNLSSTLLDAANSVSDMALQRAQARSANANATGQEITNDWLDAQNSAQYSQTLETIEKLKVDKQLSQSQAKVCEANVSVLKESANKLYQEVSALQYTNQALPQKLSYELQTMSDTILEIQSRTANIKADTKNKDIQRDLMQYEKQLKQVEVNLAKYGINFKSDSIIDSIARIALSSKGTDLLPQVLDSLASSVTSVMDYLHDKVPSFIGSIGQRLLPVGPVGRVLNYSSKWIQNRKSKGKSVFGF